MQQVEATYSYGQWRSNFTVTAAELEQQYTLQDTDNRTMGAFAGFARHAADNPNFEYYVKLVHDTHPGISPKIAFNLLLRGFQDDALSNEPQYPFEHAKVDAWSRIFADISNDVIREGILEINLRQHLLSNVSERYKTVPLLIHLMKDRFKHQPSVLDLGCSQMHGGKRLAFGADTNSGLAPFRGIELLDGRQLNKPLSQLATMVLRQSVEYGHITGIDIRNIDDPAIKRFAKSCSFYPDELRNPEKVAAFDNLEALDPNHERVAFYQADLTSDADAKKFRDQSPVKKFDIIIFSTVLYQVSPAEQIAMKVSATNMLSDDGILIIQDAPDGDFTKKYNYVTSVIDGRQLEKGEQVLLKWATGRCLRAVPMAGKIAFEASAAQTITERLYEVGSK